MRKLTSIQSHYIALKNYETKQLYCPSTVCGNSANLYLSSSGSALWKKEIALGYLSQHSPSMFTLQQMDVDMYLDDLFKADG